MASLIGALRVTLGLDSANFDTDARKVKSKARGLASDVKKELSGAFDLQGAMKGLLGTLAISEIAALTGRALDYASSLGEVAQQLGVTTKDLQSYRYAASQVGIEQETMDKSLAKLTRTIGEAAAGSKAQATTFRELGVSVTDANGNLLTAGAVIPRLADALSKIKDPASRARYEVALFGKSGQALDTLLSGGSEAVDGLRDAAQRLGLVLSDDAIAKADETADKLAELKQVLEANIANAVANNAGAIYGLVDSLTSMASKVPEAIRAWKQFRYEMGLRLANVIDSSPLGLLPESVKGTGAAKRQAQLGLQELQYQAAIERLGLGSGLSFLNRSPSSRPSSGGLPTVRAGGGGRARAARSGGADDWLTELRLSTAQAVRDGIGDGLLSPDKEAAEQARHFYDRLGLNPDDDMKSILASIDHEKDLRLEAANDEVEQRFKDEDALHEKRMEQTRTLTNFYATAMRGGTDAFLKEMADVGFSIIAQMAAGLTTGNSLGGAFNAAIGAVLPGFGLPGFATGGSFRVGGVGGVDRNVVAFKATKGEIVDIRRPGSNDSAGGRQIVEIVPSKYFDVHVREAAAPVGQAAAIGGSRMAQTELARKGRRRLS